MISNLQKHPSEPACARVKRRPKGWTVERPARQSARARETQPWRHATGPRSETGKARSAMNGMKHGFRSRAHIFKRRHATYVLRLAARNIAIVRTVLRLRRLLHSLRRRPQTPFSMLQLNHLHAVLDGLTSAPMPIPPEGLGFWPPQE